VSRLSWRLEVIEIGPRMSELEDLGLRRKTRLVSGPQGPRVVLDGKPTLVLCSGNYLGLADHPRVREAAAAAAMRWGAGAAAARLTSGTMTIHRRLEERLAAFLQRESALLFGSGYLAAVGVIAALARPGDVVFCDEDNSGSILDGCRLSGAEVFVYDHRDTDHLRWGVAKAEGRAALIVTESVFSLGGDVAPLSEIVELASRRRLRVVVDEGSGLGTLGPGGRGALAQLGLEDRVDAIIGTLGRALASYGGFVACRREMAEYLLNSSRTLQFSSAPSPPAAAAALAALTLLEQRPQLVARLSANVRLLRRELENRGFSFGHAATAIMSIRVGDGPLASELAEAALHRGVLTDPIGPPLVPAAASRLRLAVMASHRSDELREAAEALADASRSTRFEPAAVAFEDPIEEPEFELGGEPIDVDAGRGAPQIFDVEAVEGLAA
jgi:glycine C-acetyltransferase/8-amino-7-oxononanoate synthase